MFMRKRMSLAVAALSLVAAGHGANPARAEERVLLVAKPQLWSAPEKPGKTVAQAWTAGRRLCVLKKEEGSTPATGIAFADWYQVRDAKSGARGWLPDAYLAAPAKPVDPASLESIGTEQVDRYHALPPEYNPKDLVQVGPSYEKDTKPMLRREAAEALEAMLAAARADGVCLKIVSGYRSWEKQQALYERRVRQTGINQQTVAKPGHSEHQLGTAVDLTDGDEEHLLKMSFGETPAGQWLLEHAWAYGFAISFTEHNRPHTGCQPEPWHYRYWGISLARGKHFEALGKQ